MVDGYTSTNGHGVPATFGLPRLSITTVIPPSNLSRPHVSATIYWLRTRSGWLPAMLLAGPADFLLGGADFAEGYEVATGAAQAEHFGDQLMQPVAWWVSPRVAHFSS